MLTLRHRLLALLMPAALCLGLMAVGFGHRGLQASPHTVLAESAALMGLAQADLCGSDKDSGDAIAASCEACRLVGSVILPGRTDTARAQPTALPADWPRPAPVLHTVPSPDRNDPARAPPLA